MEDREKAKFQQFSVKKRRDCFRIRPFAMTDYENLSCHC